MPATINRPIRRRLAARDTSSPPFDRALIAELDQGGRTFSLRPAGCRRKLTFTWQEVWAYGVQREIKLLRAAKRK